ncbi:MAG TPA: hypothetical protein VEQ41_01685 [Solirubrobacterales bacterium]|nr:hypothetical protein [Solirubrobacterales bacterium]
MPTDSPILIRSVGVGTQADPAAEYVMLQMTVDGQQDLDGVELRFYGPDGVQTDDFALSGDELVGQAQRPILLARPPAALAPGFPAPDFELEAEDALAPAAGALCLTGPFPADCATWGSFPQPSALGLADPQAANAELVRAGEDDVYDLGRSIGHGCSTWLDPEDDARPSPAHFFDGVLPPNSPPMTPPEPTPAPPRNNAEGVPGGFAPCQLTTGFDITPRNPTNDTTPFFDYDTVPREYGSEFRCRLAPHPIGAPAQAPFAPCEGSGVAYGPLADGKYDFEVFGLGEAGPDPTPLQWTFEVDTVPPDTTITATPGPVSSGFSASFSFASSEEHPTFVCRLDNGPTQTCEPGKTFFFLADGNHTFRVWASDQATNQDPTPAVHTFFVDTAFGDATAPFTAILSGPPKHTKQPSARFTYTTNEPGGRFECRLDGQAFAACEPAGKAYAGVANGRHVFEVRAVDRAGNVDPTPEPYVWTVDGPVPETTLTKVPPGVLRVASRRAKRVVVFGFESSRARSTFACRLDGGPFRPCASPKRIRVGVGRHRFEAYAIDALGNADPTPVRRSFRVLPRGGDRGLFRSGRKKGGGR